MNSDLDNDTVYLDVRGDEHDGYWVTGNRSGLAVLRSKCSEALEVQTGQAQISDKESEIVGVQLGDRPAQGSPPTRWQETLRAILGFLLFAAVVVALVRGCFALKADVGRLL